MKRFSFYIDTLNYLSYFFVSTLYGTKYSRMDQVKSVEETWSILEYFVPYIDSNNNNFNHSEDC